MSEVYSLLCSIDEILCFVIKRALKGEIPRKALLSAFFYKIALIRYKKRLKKLITQAGKIKNQEPFQEVFEVLDHRLLEEYADLLETAKILKGKIKYL